MNISNIKLLLSWDDINAFAVETAGSIPMRDINIKYEDIIVVSGRVKGGMPVKIHGDNFSYDRYGLQVHIKNISMLVRMPDMFKRSFINDLVAKNDCTGKIIYNDQTDMLVLTKGTLREVLPFEFEDIKSIDVDNRGLEIEFINVNPIKYESNAAVTVSGCEAFEENDETEYIIENSDVKTEDFDIDKAGDYYDRLRLRIENYIKSGMPKKLHYLIPYMLLLPDVLALLTRLFLDRRISAADRAIVIAGLTYIISPLDMIPDLVLPFGTIDDLSVGFFVLDKLLLSVPEEVLKDNFSGSENAVSFIKNGYTYIKNIVPGVKMDKILRLFNDKFKRGMS